MPFLSAINKKSGETVWRTKRTSTKSWSSPIVAQVSDRDNCVVVSSGGTVTAYSSADGSQEWQIDGIEGNSVPSPTTAGRFLLVGARLPEFATDGQVQANCCLDLSTIIDGKPLVIWRADKAICDYASPVTSNGYAYVAGFGSDSLAIIDVGTDPSSPSLVGSYGSSSVHQLCCVFWNSHLIRVTKRKSNKPKRHHTPQLTNKMRKSIRPASNFCQSNPVLTQTMAAPAGGAVLWSEDILRPPDSRVDLVPELIPLVREPTFVRPSYRSIGMLGGCRSVPPIMPFKGSRSYPAESNWMTPLGALVNLLYAIMGR